VIRVEFEKTLVASINRYSSFAIKDFIQVSHVNNQAVFANSNLSKLI
jgi:hypothetical protein